MTAQRKAVRLAALPLLPVLAAPIPAAPAAGETMIEVNRETRETHVDCGAAWSRLKSAYRRAASGACRDAGGVKSVAEPTTDKKPVGGKFICTLEGRIHCRK